ncbi:meiosis-specific nuclear structural protein 1-like [Cimex lectularius]|uniref:Meiosis-specific nuclear structural protein 1 n=1 Tax=Cimex lectularius TaxID=79782 RepID=A0A8I6TFF0_CIMLE|nr:meiosis-specific nuclear structural protein 1-like [Cimex lectularius]
MSYIKKMFKEKDALLDKKANIAAALRHRSDRKVRDMNVMRRLYQEKKEVRMEEALARAQESAGWRVEELKQEEKLAYHMDKAKKEEMRQLKERQILWQSREICELHKTLKLAYYQKELASTGKEAAMKGEMEKAERMMEKEHMKAQEQIRESCEKAMQKAHQRKKQQYKEGLQDQIIDNHKLKILQYQKQLKETALINDAVRIEMEEDEKREEELQKHKQHIKEEIKSFQMAKQFWSQREKEYEEEEDRRLVNYLEMRKQRELKLQHENLQKEDERQRKEEAVINKIKQLEGFRHERERIAQLLLDEETRVKTENAEKAKLENMQRFKQESRNVFLAQLQFKLAQKEEEKRMDRIYSLQLKEKIEQDRLKELQEKEEARLKKLKYGEELRQGLEDLHRQKFMDMLLSIKEEEGLQAEKEKYIRQVNEERRRMINEHIPHLIGFLPAGIIKDEDVPYLNPELRELLKVQSPLTDF